MISPGPVVITATFVGYLVARFTGALAATIGIFLPSFILVLAAAIGTILGACLLLGKVAIGDWITVPIGLASLAALFRWKVNNPLLKATAAAIGLIGFPLMHPAWVLIK